MSSTVAAFSPLAAAGNYILITTDGTLTKALFKNPTSTFITETVLDYLETNTQVNTNFTGARNVFLPAETKLYVVTDGASSVICYFENTAEIPLFSTGK